MRDSTTSSASGTKGFTVALIARNAAKLDALASQLQDEGIQAAELPHKELSQHGVYVAHVAISAWIGSGNPDAEASAIAAVYPKLYETRTEPELHYVALAK